ncbi:MAG: glycosyltransferase family 2 protein [Candidatus Binatia bacterium]
MPKVSVLIPTHNRASFLPKAVKSVLEQTHQDFEIIVVDDASKDETRHVLKGLQDPRIRYFRHDTNRGEAASTNTGIRHATGDYVAFLHDDDAWLPEKLERQVDFLNRSGLKVGAVYSGYLTVDAETGKVLGTVMPQKRGNLSRELSTKNWIGVPSTVLLRRECFDSVGFFDEDIDEGADYDMWIRLSRAYQFDYIEEPLALYAVHGNRLSANYAMIVRGKEAQLRKHAEFFACDKKSYSRFFLSLGVLHCYNGNLYKGREALLRAITIYPFEVRPYFNLFLSLWGTDNFKRLKTFKDRVVSSF